MSKQVRQQSSIEKRMMIWLLFMAILLALSGCSAQPVIEQPAFTGEVLLDANTPVGQTFVARYDGLSGVYFTLSPGEPGDGEIRLHLRSDAQASEDLAVSYRSVPIASISGPLIQGFFIPAQANSNQTYYYAFLEVTGSGSVEVGSGPGDSYLDGALYQNHTPRDAQAAFQLSYSRRMAWLEVLGEVIGWAGILLIAGFLFILPGWGVLSALLPEWGHRYWGEKMGLAAGLSLALYPIFFLWTDWAGLHLGPAYAWVLPLLGGYLLFWRNHAEIKRAWQRLRALRLGNLSVPISVQPSCWLNLTLIASVLIIFAARFWTIRAVDVPLWGDSLQHAMITQLMLNNGGLFTSWQPFAPYESLTTHFGISTLSAVFGWITGMNSTQATLWVGQIINGLAILTLYPLATKIGKGNRWAGIGALIVGGLVSILPATYVNWGRFAQLAGQAVLPVSLSLLWEAVDQEKKRSVRSTWPHVLLAGLALTGMTLSYYRMPFYYATFIVVLLFFWGLPAWRFTAESWAKCVLRLMLIGLIGIGFFLPWGMRLVGGNLAGAMEAGVTTSTSMDTILAGLNDFRTISEYVSPLLLGLVGLAVLFGLVRRNWMAAALPLWFILLIGYMIGSAVKLPGANMLQGFAILIAIYLPIALLLGWLLGEIIHWTEILPLKWGNIQPGRPIPGHPSKGEGETPENRMIGAVSLPEQTSSMFLAAASLLLVIAAGWFGWQQRLILDMPRYALVNRPDLRAMSWIQTSLPNEAHFLVQGFPYVQTVAGSDAGWWLPLLAQRTSTLPTQYTQFNEIPTPPDYTQQVVALYDFIRQHPIGSTESIELLCAWGVTHIYQGQGQGQVGGPPLYRSEELNAAPAVFTQVYHQDRVFIFALNPAVCTPEP